MNEAEIVYWLFVVANSLFFVATIPLISKIIKNRNILKDYSPTGSTITFLAVFLTIIAFGVMGNFISVMLSITTLLLWLFASIYSIKGFLYIREKDIKDNVYNGKGTNYATKGIRCDKERKTETTMSMVRGTYYYARPLCFRARKRQ